MINNLFIMSIFIGLTGYVLSAQLFAPGKVLDNWRILIISMTEKVEGELKGKIRMVLYGCEACLSGQIGLWYMLKIQLIDHGYFDFWLLFQFVILCIFFGAAFGKMLYR